MHHCAYIFLILIYSSVATINNDWFALSPWTSIPQQTQIESEIIGIQSISSLTHESKSAIDKKNNSAWNGGIILTHESNLQSLKGRSETTIASTRCGNLIFVGFNSAQGFCFDNDENHPRCPGAPDGFVNGGTAYSVSLDAGKTWKYMYAPPPLDSDIFTKSQPWLSMGGKSAKYGEELLYFAGVAVNKSTGFGDFIGLSVHVARIIYKNNDPRERAINFEWIRASLIPKIQDGDILGKGAIAADPLDANKAYVSLTLFSNTTDDLQLYATHDAAVSWQGPVVLQKEQTDVFHQNTYPVVAANGDVYVCWYEYVGSEFMTTLRYRFIKSIDGGITFPDPPISINPDYINFNPIAQLPIPHNNFLLHSQPTMDVFTTNNCYHNYLNRIIAAYPYSLSDAFDGNLVGFIDDDSTVLNSVNIGISYSDDRGESWHFIDPFKEGIAKRFVKRIFPTVSVSSDGKSVNIGYLEIKEVKKPELAECNPLGGGVRTSLYHSMVDHYYIHSDNGGITWSDPIKLNEEAVDWCMTVSDIRPNYGVYMLAISDSKGYIRLAGVTNGFTLISGLEPLTAVDVIYYDSNGWRQIYTALMNGKHKEENELLSDLENESELLSDLENIEIHLPWTVIVISICGIAIFIASPFIIWMKMSKTG